MAADPTSVAPALPSRNFVRGAVAALRRRCDGDVSVCCFVFALVVAVLCRGPALAAALALSLGLAVLVYPAGLATLRRRRTWVLLAMLVGSASLLGPHPGVQLGPVGLSAPGALLGLGMSMRAVIIVTAVSGLVSTVPVDRLGGALERLGLQGLGFAVGVAFNLLPLVQRSLVTSWQVVRQRAGLRRPLMAIRLLFIASVSHCLRCADEVVLAAEARAYAPGVRARPRLRLRAGTLVLAVVLAVVAALLVAVAHGL